MSQGNQYSPKKKMKQDIIAELNNVLSVRAEQIRQRLVHERETKDNDTEDEDDIIEIKLPEELEQKRTPVSNQSLIPVSRARLRRREKARVTSNIPIQKENQANQTSSPSKSRKLQKGSNVDIRNYRPGYTWSKGGRVKELRIRCIARKYLFSWQRKVFGRVPLSVAKHHFEVNLMHKAFGMWYDYWWSIVKEWRLGVRAECHHRFKLGLCMFLKWRKFVSHRRAKNAKHSIALRLNNRHLALRMWKEWKNYIQERRKHLMLKQEADEFRDFYIIRSAWGIWKKRHQLYILQQENESSALQFWSYRIQAQHWLAWKSALEARKCQQERFMDASVYHNSILVSKCLKAWTLYVRNRKAKKYHAEFADRVCCANLKVQSFNHWYQRWHFICSLRQHHLKMACLSVSFRTRWAFWRMRQYVTKMKERRAEEEMADKHYQLQLMRFGLDSFHLNVVHTHIKVMRTHLAGQLRTTQLQRGAWKIWIGAYDEREEAKMASQNELAREYHNTKIMGKYFSFLVDYAQRRQLRKSQYAQAEAHHYLRTAPKYLFHMRLFVHLEKTCRENAIKAQEFRSFGVMHHVFNTWLKAANRSRDNRMMYRVALLHHESVALQSTFTMWRHRTEEALLDVEKMAHARDHYLWTALYRAWSIWRNYVSQKKTGAFNYTNAIRHCYLRTLKTSFVCWKKWLHEKKAKKALAKRAESHYKLKRLRFCIAGWKIIVNQGKSFKSVADARYQEYARKLLSKMFSEWRGTTLDMARERRREIAATVHHNRSLILRVIQEWHHYSTIQAYKHSQSKQLLQEATEKLQNLKVSLYLKHWRDSTKIMLESQKKLEQAKSHHTKCLQLKALHAWKAYCRTCLKKRLLARQCQWFHNVRICAKHFLLWKDRQLEQREENGKLQLALWQWSLILQQKVLLSWKSYIEARRHKKSRMVEAAAMHRQQLLREACSQWLATADGLAHVRSEMAARHQAKAIFNSFHLVQKCALHWKVWTRRRVAAKGGPAKRNVAMTLLVSNVRLTANSSQLPVVNQIYPGHSNIASYDKEGPLKPVQATISPSRPSDNIQTFIGIRDLRAKRPPPKLPAFLVDSLKRAGLFSAADDCSDPESHGSVISGGESTPSLSDLRVDAPYPECPATGRFEPNDNILAKSHHPRQNHMNHNQDWSFSAEVMSGSTSTLGQSDGIVRPLLLSNSDTEHSGARTGSTSTNQSPHMFTPSTQRSQFSGNPLLYSSPVSDTNTARETWRTGVLRKNSSKTHTGKVFSDEVEEKKDDEDVRADIFGLDMGTSALVRGNLGEGWKGHDEAQLMMSQGMQKLEEWQREQENQKAGKQSYQEAGIVLLKPEDFMMKSAPANRKGPTTVTSSNATYDKKKVKKHTPRAFASYDTDPTSGLPPMAEWRSVQIESSSNFDSQKEITGPLRHTPRESPRRSVPQGILHNKVSDSDGDVSPLNTARSRGTVTFASPKSPSPEEEIIHIRDRLKHFSQQKKKLRSLRKQYRQLSDWLMEQAEAEDHEDEDSKNATEELDMLRLEVAELQVVVDSQRPICERLVLRAQTLTQELQIPVT